MTMKTSCALFLVCALLLALCVAVPDGLILWEAADALYTGGELPQLSLSILPYGGGLALCALLAWIVSYLLVRKKASVHDALCWFAWALGLGILLARFLYCAAEPAYYNPHWLTRMAALRIWDGGMAMTGALLGILLAGKFAPRGAALAPFAMPLFLAGARLCEIQTQLGYGPSVDFEGMLSRQIGYAVRLNVSLLEAAAALIIFICMLLWVRRAARQNLVLSEKTKICAFLIFYGVTQIFMESLRKDRHLIWRFTKVQQILSIVMILCALLYLAKSSRERRHAVAITLCAAAPLVALEFALDRADVSIFLLYGAYLIVLVAYLKAAYAMLRRSPAASCHCKKA